MNPTRLEPFSPSATASPRVITMTLGRQLVRLARKQTLAAGETLYKEHSPGRTLYWVRSGQLREFKSFFGKTHELGVVVKGGFLGQVSFFCGHTRTASVQARTDCLVWSFEYEELYPLLEGHAGLALLLLERLAERTHVVQQELLEHLVQRNLELEMSNTRLNLRLKERAALQRSNEELSVLATRDGLTGCLNRRGLNVTLEQWVERELPFSLVLFDIDHFKNYNDRNGHLLGDRLLTSLVRVVQEHLRDDDVLARFGGEEFAILLSSVGPPRALDVARRVSAAILEYPFEEEHAQPLGMISISGGVAHFPQDGKSGNELLHRADERMYRAKNGGRNRIEA